MCEPFHSAIRPHDPDHAFQSITLAPLSRPCLTADGLCDHKRDKTVDHGDEGNPEAALM